MNLNSKEIFNKFVSQFNTILSISDLKKKFTKNIYTYLKES